MRSTAIRLGVLAGLVATAAVAADEFRGLWVCPWEMNSPAAVTEVVAFARDYGFNAILFEVRYRGDALYVPHKRTDRFPNAEPRSPHLAGQPADFDPLEELITQGHAAGLQVHAWVTTFVVANRKTPTDAGHPMREHPDWLLHAKDGDVWDPYGMAWLDAARPEVRDYLYNVFLDIVANYAVDGLHLDYVRYPTATFGDDDDARARFRAETGRPADDDAGFAAWRRDAVTSFVSRLYAGINAVRPECRLTAAVFAARTTTAYNDCLQDWGTWLARGSVDAVIPMAYGRKPDVIQRQVEDAASVAAGRHVYGGILVPEVKDDAFDAAVGDEMVAKAGAVRAAGAQGIVVFSWGGLRKKDALVARALKTQTFEAMAAAPAMPWKAAPGLTVVALVVGGEKKYAVKVEEGAPHRYAYLLAKELSARVPLEVNIQDGGDRRFRVYAGAFTDRADADELRAKLAAWGYGVKTKP